MVKACAITDKGIEKITVLELDEIINAKGRVEENVVVFESKDYESLLRFCYLSQSIERMLVLLAEFEFDKEEDLLAKAEAELKKTRFEEWLEKEKSFKVVCERRGEHAFTSQGVEEAIGACIITLSKETLGFSPGVSMDCPDTVFYVFINQNKAYIGIDLVGRDLSKRKYRVFSAPGIINAKLAYALVRLAGYSKKDKMIDLFCKAGIICIEAALYTSHKSINYYFKDFAFKKLKPFLTKDWEAFFKTIDSEAVMEQLDITGMDSMLRNVEASKKNAKLAGIDKLISFSRMDVEWLDTKLDKESVSCIISKIPCPSKHLNEAEARKLYKELFYQADFIMKKKGRLALLGENLGILKKIMKTGFKIVKEDELWAGMQRYDFVMIEKV